MFFCARLGAGKTLVPSAYAFPRARRFGSDASWSAWRSFITPPAPGDDAEVRLVVVADHGHYAKVTART